MGSVLENGLYLPDEGERNAYNGLKGNWNTLDNLVETVTALSSTGLIRKPVDALPITDIQTNVIYMLKATKPNGDVYRIEYMYIDDHWDPVGTSETTLDDYYTKTETDDLPAVKSGINATKVGNYDTHIADTDIHVSLANKQTWDGKQNALDTAQTAAVNSGITGTKVTGYDTHVGDADIHVTAADKTAWNSKQDGLSQTQLAAVNSGVNATKVTGYDSHIADTDVHVTTVDKATWNGKQDALTQTQLNNIATIPDKANSADLATVATSGSYTDLINAPTIPTVNNATLTIQKNGTDVATFTANASSNVTANLSIPVNTSDLNNDAGFLTQHNPVDDELSATSENALQNKVVKSELDGKAPLVHTHAASDVTSGTFNIARIPNLDASKITSGTIDIARLPKGSLERLIKVANQAARYALTADDVQLGDTVQQLDTGVMYVVTDETKLDSADGYTEFTAGSASSVPWTGVTGKPNDYPPSSHTHTKSQITDFPTLATVATSGSYNDLNNIPASFTPSSHVHGNLTNDGKIGTTANKPLITGTGGVVQAGSFGNAANTFCEGNDSRLSDARTPVAHTHTKSDVTDLLNSNFIPSANNAYNLGSSSYQWNNLYAKNYYYNGTAWGLDKENVWGNSNRFTKSINLGSITSYTDCTLGFTGLYNNLFFNTRGSSNITSYGTYVYYGYSNASSDRGGVIRMVRTTDKRGDTNDGYIPDLSFNLYKISPAKLFIDFMEAVRVTNDGTENSLKPITDNATDLGTSTNRFKSLNGINPGALSLPNVRAAVADPISTVGWNLSGSRNKYTPTEDGWFYIRVAGTGSCAINIHNGDTDNSYPTWFNTSTGGYATLVVPCEKGISLYIYISATSIEYCSFHPCLGNV